MSDIPGPHYLIMALMVIATLKVSEVDMDKWMYFVRHSSWEEVASLSIVAADGNRIEYVSNETQYIQSLSQKFVERYVSCGSFW